MAAQSGGLDLAYREAAESYWSSIRYCGNQTSSWIYLLIAGLVAKRWDVMSGPFVKSLARLLLFLIVPCFVIRFTLSSDLQENSLRLLPSILVVWLLKLGIAAGLSYTVTKLVTIPTYFTRTFCALLMTDSLMVPNVFYTAGLVSHPQSPIPAQANDHTTYSEDEYLALAKQFQIAIKLLNSLLLFGIVPWLLKNDYLYLKTFGESIVWINQEPYLAKFETTDMMDQQNYELIVQRRSENQAFLMAHIKQQAFVSLLAAIGLFIWRSIFPMGAAVTSAVEHGLDGISDICMPASMIILGCLVTKLDVGFKRGLMASSKLVMLHAGSKLYLIPKLLLLFSSLVTKLFPESGSLIAIGARELARSSSWPPDVILLLYSVDLSFAYKEVAYFIYYDWVVSLLSLPLLMWQWS